MRKIFRIVISVLITLPLYLSGQNIRIKRAGMETTLSYNYLEDLKAHFLFSYTFKQHEPFAGFELPVGTEPVSTFGFNAGYRFYPNKIKQNFDLYFLYMIQVTSRKMYSNSTVKGISIANLIGYGFNVYFNNNLYLTHHIAAGTEKSQFGSYGSFTDFGLMINLGLGIKINGGKSKKEQ